MRGRPRPASWSRAARLTPPTLRTTVTLVAIATICMWMMWAGAWLHQWHPMIDPEPEK